MPVLQLRPAGEADAAFLAELYAATRRQELAPAGWPEAVLAAFLRSQLAVRDAQCRALHPAARDHIVLVDGAAAGRLLVDRASAAWCLVDLALLPQHRGRGIGTTLLRDLQRQAAAAGCVLRLHVDAANPARRLYRRLGFSERPGEGVYRAMQWQPARDREAEPVEAPFLESLS